MVRTMKTSPTAARLMAVMLAGNTASCSTANDEGIGADSGGASAFGSDATTPASDAGGSGQDGAGNGGSGSAGRGNGSAEGGPGSGADAGAPAAATSGYDGARPSTVSFDAAWKFHQGDVTGAQAAGFDDSSWTALDVPHDWSISLPIDQSSPAGGGGGYFDGGVGWYRKSFELPAMTGGQKVFLQFDGIYMDSTVWVNGSQVCARPYGYISFECDFPSVAKLGSSNVVAVRVNNQQPSSRWYSGSGIYRHVWLKTVNPVRV